MHAREDQSQPGRGSGSASYDVGLIGLGNLGSAIGSRLLEVGHHLSVWNRTAARSEPLGARGAIVAENPRKLAEASDFVLTVLADGAALMAVLNGPEGLLAAERLPRAVIDCSTISPSDSARAAHLAAERSLELLRAPVSGSQALAAQGALSLMISGDRATFESCRPVLQALGQTMVYLGPGEEARYLKLVTNLMVGITAQMMAEALALGRKAGLEWQQMLEFLGNSAIGSPLVKYKQAALLRRDFSPAATTRLIEKDFDLILEVARELQVPVPTAALVRQLYAAASASGHAERDFFSLVLLEEGLAGLAPEVPPPIPGGGGSPLT